MLLITLFTLLLAPFALGSGSYCTQSPWKVIEPFVGYAPAESYCSGNHPVPPSTSTKKTCAWHTSWHTSTKTATSTATATATYSPYHRRAAANTASAWSSCSSAGNKSGWLGSACSCIESTPTSTVSPLVRHPCSKCRLHNALGLRLKSPARF